MKTSAQQLTLNHLFRKILVLTLLLYLAALYFIWDINLEDHKSTLRHSSSVLSQAVRTTLRGHDLILRGIGKELIALGALQSPENGRDLIERMNHIDPGMAGFGLARADGQLILVSGIKPGQPLANLATSPNTQNSFKEFLKSRAIRVGRPYFFKALNQWVLPVRAPIFDDKGNMIAIMTAGYKLKSASAAWSDTNQPKHIQLVIVRDDGYPIFAQPLLRPKNGDAVAETYGKPIQQANFKRIRKLKGHSNFLVFTASRLPHQRNYLDYQYLAEYNLHIGALISQYAVLISWLKRILVPTILFILFTLAGFLILRRTKDRLFDAQEAISNLSAWQEAVLDGADYSIISTDTNGTIVSFNHSAQKLLGYHADEVIGKTTPVLFHDKDELIQQAAKLSRQTGKHFKPEFKTLVARAVSSGLDEIECTYIRKDGSHVPVFLSITPMYNNENNIIGFLGIAANMSDKQAMMQHLQQSELRYHALFDSASDAIFLMLNDTFVDCNPATLSMFECTREQIIGSTPQRYSPEYQSDGRLSSEKALEKINAAFEGRPQTFEWRHITYAGEPFDAEVSLNVVHLYDQPHLLATVRDITERKVYEDKLEFQAHHDSLTGLPNRTTLHEKFSHYADEADLKGLKLGLLLIDLDRFKEVNDTLGHHAGDEVLLQIGPRLHSVCDETRSTIARLGGDEFAVLIKVSSETNLEILAELIVQALREPFDTKALKVRVGASVGISIYPDQASDSHELLRAADVAMYQAKKQASGVRVYDHESDVYSTQRLALASDLTQAITEQQFVMHYQPKIDIQTGETVSFEALVRWQHPESGLLYPDAFIDLVEMSDVVQHFTQAIIELVISEKKKLNDMGFSQTVAINLSAHNLVDSSCLEKLLEELEHHQLDAYQIELELTESALMHDPESAIHNLQLFQQNGINIAIDDFGTGYSSLSYLQKLPVSALKIDRSFVMDMTQDRQDSEIVRSTIALAHSLGLKVIAEGVENEEALMILRGMNCDLAQGYGICRPQPFDKLVEWLESNQSAD